MNILLKSRYYAVLCALMSIQLLVAHQDITWLRPVSDEKNIPDWVEGGSKKLPAAQAYQLVHNGEKHLIGQSYYLIQSHEQPKQIASAQSTQSAQYHNVKTDSLAYQSAANHGFYSMPREYKHTPMSSADHRLFCLLQLDVTGLENYFFVHQYSEKDILGINILYMSDSFVRLAMTYPGYQKAVTDLYNYTQSLSVLSRLIKINEREYCVHLKERIASLYHDICFYNQATSMHAQERAHRYNINLLPLFVSHYESTGYNTYQDYMHILMSTEYVERSNKELSDCVGHAAKVGLHANKYGHESYAMNIAQFCWTMIRCAWAFEKGLFLGTQNTVHALAHPISTASQALVGIAALSLQLAQLTGSAAHLAFLYATDSDTFYLNVHDLEHQLKDVLVNSASRLRQAHPEDIIQNTTSFLTESMLSCNIASFAAPLSRLLLGNASKYLEYLKSPALQVYLPEMPYLAINTVKNTALSAFAKKYAQIGEYGVSLRARCRNAARLAKQYAQEKISAAVTNMMETVGSRPALKQVKSATVEPKKLTPLGRGQTGRFLPNDLHEQLVLEKVIADPNIGKEINLQTGMTDPRWHKSDGWVKKAWRYKDKDEKIEIHFVVQKVNDVIVAIDDFKFK